MPLQTISFGGRIWKVQLRAAADRSVAAEIFKWREYRAAAALIRAARDPILDAGAHCGLFTLYVRSLNAAVPIIALEPEPNNLKLLREHLLANDIAGVTVIPGALAGESGPRLLAISPESHNHALLPAGARPGAGNIAVAAYSLAAVLRPERVTRVSMIKLDIEGGEYEVFAGLGAKDFAKIRAVIMEYHNRRRNHYRELEKMLRENGFGVQIFPSKFDRTMGFMFGKNKRFH